jgi:hypothetical protein
MDEITDQFRTEDAEEFKQLQAELEAKNCRILQFKLRKAEKRNENTESEKATLEGETYIYFFCNTKLIFTIDFLPVGIQLFS